MPAPCCRCWSNSRWLVFGALLATFMTTKTFANEWFLRAEKDGKTIEGLPIFWDSDEFYLFGRDGQMRKYDIKLAKKSRRVEQRFRPFTQGEMRGLLAREFGGKYEITATGNYLVVHPIGESKKWPPRFEQLYREMLVYFGTRGIDVKRPTFPLVAVVLPDKQTFMKYASSTGTRINGMVLGYYTPISNRIFLYDSSGGGRYHSDWRENAATLVHEAAHQTAYNVGLHKRLAVQPRWLTEGLGTLFEAPGVYDAGHHPAKSDRVNRTNLELYRRAFSKKGLPKGTVKTMVAKDDLFRINSDAAYTLAWALTFTLSETEPTQYARFLALNNKKKRFVELTPLQRIRDFQSLFGADIAMIEARMHRTMMSLD